MDLYICRCNPNLLSSPCEGIGECADNILTIIVFEISCKGLTTFPVKKSRFLLLLFCAIMVIIIIGFEF